MLYRYGALIEEIVHDLKHLWKYDMLSPKIENYLRSQMKSSLKLFKVLITCCLGTITLMAITAILDEKKSVPLLCWTPDNLTWTVLIFVCEIIFLLEAIYYVASLDSFYFLNCNNLTLQIYLLRKALQSVDFEIDSDKKILQKIIYCSQQHERLLRFVIQRIYLLLFSKKKIKITK